MAESNSFVFYESFYKALEALKDQPDLQKELLMSIIEYGLYGKYESSNAMVMAIMANIVISIDGAKKRHASAVAGGEASDFKYGIAQILALKSKGMTYQQIADEIGCSTKTVQRKVAGYNKIVAQKRLEEAKAEDSGGKKKFKF